jgi:membrane protease subunit (stomatin/prohibitin family)
MAGRSVISTLNPDGTEVLGPGVLLYHYPGNDIVNGSLLTVESNHFCVLKSRGVILNVYETGQYPVEPPQRPLLGSFQQTFYSGQAPWQYEALFVSRAKSVAKAKGVAVSRELAELVYDVDYYVHVDTAQDAVKLVTQMPYQGHVLTAEALGNLVGPVVEQAVNQLVQVTPLRGVNERIHEITELVDGRAQDFLYSYGVTLSHVKVLIRPRDERVRELISLRAFGLSELEAVRYHAAMKMLTAPNMAAGEPFNVGLTGAGLTGASLTGAGPAGAGLAAAGLAEPGLTGSIPGLSQAAGGVAGVPGGRSDVPPPSRRPSARPAQPSRTQQSR